mmetsp:Transcript_6313/g.17156  ORF Transcript_6313/g.17156 Transcript_6313/m.17156 type:complete len:265 (-) Transcript_6313:116-910(-)
MRTRMVHLHLVAIRSHLSIRCIRVPPCLVDNFIRHLEIRRGAGVRNECLRHRQSQVGLELVLFLLLCQGGVQRGFNALGKLIDFGIINVGQIHSILAITCQHLRTAASDQVPGLKLRILPAIRMRGDEVLVKLNDLILLIVDLNVSLATSPELALARLLAWQLPELKLMTDEAGDGLISAIRRAVSSSVGMEGDGIIVAVDPHGIHAHARSVVDRDGSLRGRLMTPLAQDGGIGACQREDRCECPHLCFCECSATRSADVEWER